MIHIDRNLLAAAADALVVAARSARDGSGMAIYVGLPQTGGPDPVPGIPAVLKDRTDYDRIRAIAVGAVVALIGQPIAGFTDEADISFGVLSRNSEART